MTITDRRSFLRGMFSTPAIVAASSLMPISLKPFLVPRLAANGVADDTAALQWMIDEAYRTGTAVNLTGGVYRITAPLIVRGRGLISQAHFRVAADTGVIITKEAAGFRFENGSFTQITTRTDPNAALVRVLTT